MNYLANIAVGGRARLDCCRLEATEMTANGCKAVMIAPIRERKSRDLRCKLPCSRRENARVAAVVEGEGGGEGADVVDGAGGGGHEV